MKNRPSIEDLKEHHQDSSNRELNAHNQIDVITIAVDGFGILFANSIIQNILDKYHFISIYFAVFAIFCFAASAIANFQSQIISAKLNRNEAEWAVELKRLIKEKKKDSALLRGTLDRKIRFGKNLNLFNFLSRFFMIIGVLLVVSQFITLLRII